MQLLRCLLTVIYTTDIASAQKASPSRTKVLAALYSKPLKKLYKKTLKKRIRNKENKGRKPNLIILTQPSVPKTSVLPLLLNKNRKKPHRVDCLKEKPDLT